ncbi:MAG: LysR family transcriptional regulator [Alkaliphilus sp.]|nr:MAG: LysR family transcriptional regulator [Alkaliphilus sp.]
MDFKQLDIFINVVKHGTFSKTAEKIYLTQPTISAHIAGLEKELGIILFERKGKTTELSEGGKMFYPLAVDIIEMKEIAISAARSYKEGVRGKLVIGASTTVCNYILPKRMNDFIEIFPDVVFKIKQGNSAEVINDVLDYSTDLGIVGSIVKNNNLEYSDFAEDELVLIVPNIKKYKSWRYEVSIEDVIKEKFITREKGSGTRKRFEEELKINDISRENIKKVAEFDSLEGVIRAVEEGLGVAVVSTISTSNFVGREKMKAIRIKNFNLIRKFYIVNHKNRVLNPATEKFKEFLLNK